VAGGDPRILCGLPEGVTFV